LFSEEFRQTVAQSFIFLHGNTVSGSMKYFKKLKYFMKYFKGKKHVFYISTEEGLWKVENMEIWNMEKWYKRSNISEMGQDSTKVTIADQ